MIQRTINKTRKKTKLLITSDCFLPRWDGIARFLSQIIPDLSKQFKITVVAPHFYGSLHKVPDVRYVRFRVRPTTFGDIQFTQFNYSTIRSLVKEHDVVFNQTIGPIGMSSIHAAKTVGVPIVHYVHSIDWELASCSVKRFGKVVYAVVKQLARYFHNQCSILLVPSKAIENVIVQNKVTTKRAVVPMGIDTNIFFPTKEKKLAKKKIGLNENEFIIGFVGRVAREKDLPTLVKAFEAFRMQWSHPTKLLIVGGGLIDEIPDEPYVIKADSQSDVHKYLQALDVFVLPSFTETSSLATMEAMACGLPVVCTPVGNIPEYIHDGENGLLFSRGDTNNLTQHLLMLAADPEKRAVLAKNARATIVKRFSKRRMIKEIIRIIEEQ